MIRRYSVTGTRSLPGAVIFELVGGRAYQCELDEPISGEFCLYDGIKQVVAFACDVGAGDKIWLESKSDQFLRGPSRPRSEWSRREPAARKAKLIEMAKNGCKRPSNRSKNEEERSLGSALNNYTCKSNPSYDADFDDSIRTLAPEWFKPTYYKRLMKIV